MVRVGVGIDVHIFKGRGLMFLKSLKYPGAIEGLKAVSIVKLTLLQGPFKCPSHLKNQKPK